MLWFVVKVSLHTDPMPHAQISHSSSHVQVGAASHTAELSFSCIIYGYSVWGKKKKKKKVQIFYILFKLINIINQRQFGKSAL